MAGDPHAPLTRKILEEVIDERVPNIIDERLDARLPIILGQFTEEVLLPAVERIVHDEVTASEHRIKV